MTGAQPPSDGTEEAGSRGVALPAITRRHFLGFATATGALVYTGDLFTALAAHAAPDDIAAPPFVRAVRRREDFLALTFEFHNLILDNSTPRKLVKTNKSKPAFLGVVLPPQHLADETFDVDDDLPFPGEVRTRLAAPSRLVFEVPAGVLPLAFNLETLLDWRELPQRVVPLAQPNAVNPESRAPAPTRPPSSCPGPSCSRRRPRPDGRTRRCRSPTTTGPSCGTAGWASGRSAASAPAARSPTPSSQSGRASPCRCRTTPTSPLTARTETTSSSRRRTAASGRSGSRCGPSG